jgi:FMN reductase [NAD(P)H]
MNEVVRTLQNHRSFRQYTDKPVENTDLDAIIKSVQAAPSWIHGQQVSIIVVKDSERKRRLAELAGNQVHIEQAPVFLVFCADFYRAKLASEIEGVSFDAAEDVDFLIVGATDTGIALGNAIAAAESLGLGTVPIGGIRRNPLEVIEMLQLPKHVIPISGLCIGYPSEDPGQQPRLPKEAMCHEEKYNPNLHEIVKEYNETFSEYMKTKTNGKSDMRWTKKVAGFYRDHHYRGKAYTDVAKMLRQQGFPCKDMSEKDPE